ncbi:venom carboxylesterase-6-like isoform X2 [Coccinella septempunctata]|uniref:venom carboxylesterase-6-like isoform X2 n=1 Tax=Coccinella septempunctata TaxID=41139 RepID=UPI001D05F304|nr:venom carboxylesterase-6-like isoform X2 [Coccinella septempunctata]
MNEFYLSVFCVVLTFATSQSAPQVKTPLGKIEGFVDETANGKTFYSFEGIPYARPPVGKYRFREAVPPKPWEGVWKANTKHECMQYNHFPRLESDPVDGKEDCLYLNVYTPKIHDNLDVIVFIHGGAFMFGAGFRYAPHILLDKNVVYVTLNYRLGPLGFLSTEDDASPGNNGLKDQILALKWIKENIQFFGGNPESITISGMSAGGASVHFHTLSHKSRGLFKAAISMSGCMLNPWVLMENPLERAVELGSMVGCDSKTTQSLVDCLRRRPAKQIVQAVGKFQPWKYNPYSPFGAVVDEWSSDPVLPKHPLQLLKEGDVSDLPWLNSHTSGEGLYPGADFYPRENLKYIDEHWDDIMPHILHYNFTVEKTNRKYVNGRIREEYLGTQPITQKNFNKLIDIIGDRLFKVDIDKCIRHHAAAIKSPVYHYLFDYRGQHSFTELRSGTTGNIGVSHADDTAYVLKTALDTQSTEEDRTISKFLVGTFLQFAKTGKTGEDVEWPEVSKNPADPLKYIRISSALSLEETEELGNRKFWDSLPFEENEKLLNVRDEL